MLKLYKMILRNLKFVSIVVVFNYMAEFHPISGNKFWNASIYLMTIFVVWTIAELLIKIVRTRGRF